ncbi:MAG TPA: hypothetical protein VN831_06640, partial [Bradyrhizobium sp.]|nr:hypothetical protein [Bradyrhizobium sp.]
MPEITAKPDKSVLDYLRASAAVPICIVEVDGVCTFQLKFDPGAVSIHWLREEQAKALLKQVRHDAGRSPDAGTAEAALHAAAAATRVVLTAHSFAIGRAEAGAKKLDDYLGGLRGTGVLGDFNRRYARERAAASASGRATCPTRRAWRGSG